MEVGLVNTSSTSCSGQEHLLPAGNLLTRISTSRDVQGNSPENCSLATFVHSILLKSCDNRGAIMRQFQQLLRGCPVSVFVLAESDLQADDIRYSSIDPL